MLYLHAKRSMDLGDPIDEADLAFLRQQLEIGIEGRLSFYLDRRTVEGWVASNAPAMLVGRLNEILDQEAEAEVEVVEGNARGGVAPIPFGESTAWERASLRIPLAGVIPADFALPNDQGDIDIVESEISPPELPPVRQLNCVVCGAQIYRHERVPAPLTLVVGHGNATPDCFVCNACGYIHWFMPSPPTETSS